MFCSEATHKLFQFIRQLRKLRVSSECLGHYNLVIHSLYHSNLFINLSFASPFPELSLSCVGKCLLTVTGHQLPTRVSAHLSPRP